MGGTNQQAGGTDPSQLLVPLMQQMMQPQQQPQQMQPQGLKPTTPPTTMPAVTPPTPPTAPTTALNAGQMMPYQQSAQMAQSNQSNLGGSKGPPQGSNTAALTPLMLQQILQSIGGGAVG